MAVETWVNGKGQGLTWGAIAGTEINSLVSGDAVQSSVIVTNGTALDIFCDVSVSLGSFTSGSGAPYIGIYMYALNQDGSTYGDGRFASAAAATPPSPYYSGQIPLVPSVTQVQVGNDLGIVILPGTWLLTFFSLAGGTLASSANTLKYRTYDRQVA